MNFQRARTHATISEKVGIALTAIAFPVIIGWSMMTSRFVAHNKSKPWKRICIDTASRYFTSNLNAAQLLYALGTTLDNYTTYVKKENLPVIVQDLGEDARLLWVGPVRNDRVILYFHGGAYMLPMHTVAPSFWKYVKEHLKEKNVDVGLAILNYTLVPTADFPTQLKQARLALMHLIASGLKPQNIQLAGDSAGGGLILQLISHMLHPLEGVPHIVLSEPLGGACLLSPWVSLTADSESHVKNDKTDVLDQKTLMYWGANVLAGVPESQNPYIEAVKAPKSWFTEVNTIVDRVLITGGSAECLRDDIIAFESQLKRHHKDVTFYLQKNGVHADVSMESLVNQKSSGLTPLIVAWTAEGFIKH